MKRALRLLLAVGVLGLAAPAFSGPAEDLKALVEQGKSKDAYDLGAQHPELLGNPLFDYYFGVAATDAGHAGEGVLALERYLIQFPDNLVARAELARAYFVLGEDPRAREEFQNVLKRGPPAEIQLTIERYLDAIRAREARYQNTSTFYVEAGAGIDSNVNGGVENANISLPVLGNVTVAPSGVRHGDSFTHLAVGGQFTHPVAPGVSVYAGFGIEDKLNGSQHAFDMLSAGAAAGVSLLKDRNLYRLSLSQSTLIVENDRFRTVNGVSGEWNHRLDELQSLQASAQFAKFNYTGNNAPRNADYTGLGLNYRRVFVYPWQPVISFGVNYAKEANQQNRPDLGRDLSGLRVGFGASPNPRWGLNGGFSYLNSRYDGPDVILGTVRRDDYYAFDLAAVYLYSKNVSIRTELLVADNKSNLALYEYRRDMIAVKLRYEFK